MHSSLAVTTEGLPLMGGTESSKLRNAEGIAKLISIFCILSWRIFWMTMIHRLNPQALFNAVIRNASDSMNINSG